MLFLLVKVPMFPLPDLLSGEGGEGGSFSESPFFLAITNPSDWLRPFFEGFFGFSGRPMP